jgi:hypothetical protein
MAPPPDKKGPPKKDVKGGGSKTIFGYFTHPVEIIFVILVLMALINRISAAFHAVAPGGYSSASSSFADYFNNNILPTVSLVSYSLSALLLFGIVWNVIRLTSLNKILHATFHMPQAGTSEVIPNTDKNSRWERVLEHLNSTSPNDWKFSILEADIMLADLLDTLQYHGDTMADKLKAVEPSDFTTIESAWEAHKIRNMVAHSGGDFVLTDREARRVVDLYKAVFDEFKII